MLRRPAKRIHVYILCVWMDIYILKQLSQKRLRRVPTKMLGDLCKTVDRVNFYTLERLLSRSIAVATCWAIKMNTFFRFFFSFAHRGEDASFGYGHAPTSQLPSECLMSFVKSVSASPIFHGVVGPPRCSIPTIRLIIANKSSQRGSWELDSLHSSAPPPAQPPQLPIQIEIVTEVPGDMVQWASCLCLELAIQWISGWCAVQYVAQSGILYLLQLQALGRKYCPVIWTICIFALQKNCFVLHDDTHSNP